MTSTQGYLFTTLKSRPSYSLSADRGFFSFLGPDVVQLGVSTLPASSLPFFHSHIFLFSFESVSHTQSTGKIPTYSLRI